MKQKTEQPEQQSGPVCGERLRIARRENDISVADIAKELHLDEPKVRALEKNDFDVLGAPVFAKGHLRKYAELVGISVDDVMTDYYQMNRSVGAPPVVGLKRKSPGDSSAGPWIVAVLVVGAIGGATYWWYTQEPGPPPAVEPASLAPFSSANDEDVAASGEPGPAENPVTESAAQAETTEPDSARAEDAAENTAIDTSEDLQPAVDDAPAVAASRIRVPVVVPDSGLPQIQLELVFSGDCWTEVSDASGRRLFYDLGQAGNTVTLSGDAPLRVILGDSNNVSVRVDDNDYPIPGSAITGRLARLTLNAP
ncbi:MAG: RodZ domain-containing protein [Woeseiaceae bacterium]